MAMHLHARGKEARAVHKTGRSLPIYGKYAMLAASSNVRWLVTKTCKTVKLRQILKNYN